MIKTRFKPPTTNHEPRTNPGSALILTVVLTSLLAIIGVLFLLVSRLDKMATSGLSENKELNAAAETVIAKISQKLALDIPRTDANGIVLSGYYDYPDANNAWLACLEPSTDPNRWRQISDITGYLADMGWSNQNIALSTQADDLFKPIIGDHKTIALDPNNGRLMEQLADADGDGIADSKWIELTDITSSRGKPIYAAIRIIDNGGMLNVNTDYKFNPNDTEPNIDGSSQMQINLMALSWHPSIDSYDPNDENALLEARAGSTYPYDLNAYEQNVVWRYGQPNGPYTPFDISDELELRYRFLLNHTGIDTRLENWGGEFRTATSSTPFKNLKEWFKSAYDNGSLDPNYAYRHLATTYNMDRIIRPDGNKMVNVNRVDGNDSNDVNELFQAIRADAPIAPRTAAQTAVNLIDYRDSDSNVTSFSTGGNWYYGFEQPCIYISEIAYRSIPNPPPPKRSYAIELYKPYEDNSPVGWQLLVGGTTIDINNPTWNKDKTFYVILSENSNAKFDSNSIQPSKADVKKDIPFSFTGGTTINLLRPVTGAPGGYITVDSKPVPAASGSWLADDGLPHSIQRDIGTNLPVPTLHRCIRRLWDTSATNPTLGNNNNVTVGSATLIQAHPVNKDFTNIGEIGMILRKNAYSQGLNQIGPNDTEVTARLNLADPNFQKIFNYLTVFPPVEYVPDSNETRIKGRLNINTAPWYVIAQLPWVSQRKAGYNNSALAQAIVAYRDKTSIAGDPNYSNRAGNPGFKSIGELNNIFRGSNSNYHIDYYALDTNDLTTFPDLTRSDGANDFEERDVIFARISNLVTVRSDVFTAYILVRIGNDGPQKRVMAILDRSNVYSPGGKVRIVASHPVPDPR